MSTSAADRRIRSLRGPKPRVDPWKAHGALVEEERRPHGLVEQALTVFLAGAECPFTCSFCDLWRYTIDGPTPRGALPRQIEDALLSVDFEAVTRIKLYNASNFFDRRAVPIEDLPRIAELCAPFSGVTVESHASTIGPATVRFAERLSGRLEVALGLETIHPDACTYLNKRLDLERFDRACDYLAEHDIDLRVFVLLGAPGIPAQESVEWTVRSAEYAAERGAAIVSVIPVRGGNGEMERLASLGLFTSPTLRQLEDAFDRCVTMRDTAVTVDLWDIERLATCAACRDERTMRLKRLNVTGRAEPPIACAMCDRA
ncbi:MAG TPA: radical SAM protein [Gemmatimonadaceae bacterium]|nr:radical SAM protein [Gemmatimonadaceae bacterium]